MDDGQSRHHGPAEERLGHRIDLIIVGAVGKRRAFLNGIVTKGTICGLGGRNVSGSQWAGLCATNLGCGFQIRLISISGCKAYTTTVGAMFHRMIA